MIISVFWGPRSCEIQDCGKRIFESLKVIEEYFPSLNTWFEKGRRTPDFNQQVLLGDANRISKLLSNGRNRNDRDGGVIHELGYRLGLWNGNDSFGSTVSVQCGSTSPVKGIKNSFVIEMPTKFEDTTDEGIELLKRLISIWHAESGRIFELPILQSGDVCEKVFLELPGHST